MQSDFYFSFVCAPKFFMNKSTIKTIKKNNILRVFKAKIIHGKVNWLSQMCYKKLRNGYDGVIAWSPQKRSDLAYYEFCNIMIDTVLARE